MVEFKLLADEYKCSSELECRDRDIVVMEMAKILCNQFFQGAIESELYMVVSFFSESYYYEFIEYIEACGIRALCRVYIGADRLIRITYSQKDVPLWSNQ